VHRAALDVLAVLCLARDMRWGRVGETFGEDPHLLGVLGSALVRGYQGKSLSDPDSVIACAKHFAGYSETVGGRDASEAESPSASCARIFCRRSGTWSRQVAAAS
jgi:beta-glucosidase-like glycosyl hydrolase